MAISLKFIVALGAGLCISAAAAQQQFVYPAKGQSAEQQKRDEYECHQWAAKQTNFDPTKPQQSTAASTPPTTATGVTPGAGVGGAARGAIVGAIAGDAGAGAAAGAVAARAQSRRQNLAKQQQATQQQKQAQASQQGAYAKARAACLEGRGYSVK